MWNYFTMWFNTFCFCTLYVVQYSHDVMIWNHKKHLVKPQLTKAEDSIKKFRRWYSQFYTKNSRRLLKHDMLDWWDLRFCTRNIGTIRYWYYMYIMLVVLIGTMVSTYVHGGKIVKYWFISLSQSGCTYVQHKHILNTNYVWSVIKKFPDLHCAAKM